MVRAEDYAALKEKYGDVLGVIGDLCRSMLIPAPGHRFIVGDFSAIEARVLTWLAGDENKLETFRQFDAGIGRDIYCIAAEQVLELEPGSVGLSRESAGSEKIFELGLGYGMADKRLLDGIQKRGYQNATLEDTKRWVEDMARAEIRRSSSSGKRSMPRRWQQCDILEYLCAAGAASFELRDGVLSLRLPSGRELKYPNPVLELRAVWLPDQARRHWVGGRRDKRMYGGKWAENVTSAAARDLLVGAMKRLRAAGYVLTMHTHDEIGAEMPIERAAAQRSSSGY